jgi:hypothetical protein
VNQKGRAVVKPSCINALLRKSNGDVELLKRRFATLKTLGITFSSIFLFVESIAFGAVSPRSVPDAQIVVEGQLVASGTYVGIYQHGAVIDASFFKVMESAYEQVQRVTGLKLDTATLGPKVRVYVSDAIGPSHVWRGYQHPTDPKGIIFLNLRAY